MSNIELARQVLANEKERKFRAQYYASEGGTCGDSWADSDDYILSAAEIRYLISSEIKRPELFDGLDLKECDPESDMEAYAEECAFPDGRSTSEDDFSGWDAGGECEGLQLYIAARVEELLMIIDGELNEEQIEESEEFFDERDNFDDCYYDSFSEWLKEGEEE